MGVSSPSRRSTPNQIDVPQTLHSTVDRAELSGVWNYHGVTLEPVGCRLARWFPCDSPAAATCSLSRPFHQRTCTRGQFEKQRCYSNGLVIGDSRCHSSWGLVDQANISTGCSIWREMLLGRCHWITPRSDRYTFPTLPVTNLLRTTITQLTKRHGHLGQFRFYLCREFCVRYVIWCDNTPGTYVYYLHDSEDALTIKLLVAAVWILDTLHILFDNQLWCADEFRVYYLVIPGMHTQFPTGR
ncbi:hypothetical protein F5141DRAFT_185502 [Pisolithus sp. B1]|nr:hypothetical protein F5141DRAFT_185502 [Pisolithus sp. B1]